MLMDFNKIQLLFKLQHFKGVLCTFPKVPPMNQVVNVIFIVMLSINNISKVKKLEDTDK